MIIKTGDALIIDILDDSEEINDKKTRRALNKATLIVAKKSDELPKNGNKTELNSNEMDSEK